MMKLAFASILIAIAAADVNELFKNRNYQPFKSQPYNSQYRRPLTPSSFSQINRPAVPITPVPLASQNGRVVAILRSDSNINPDGSYSYAYETENGIAAEQQGQQKQIGESSGNVAQGGFRYTSPEGVPVVVQYLADEGGFQPQSDLLPTPPPIPVHILRALEYNAAHPENQVPEIQRRFRF